ncbi:MAG TPA: DegV family protein [Clostridiaceae bacterium]
METVVLADSCCDLPRSYIEENKVPAMSISVRFKGKEYPGDFGKSLEFKYFYDEVRKGEIATSSQENTYSFAEKFRSFVLENKAVIYIGLSSALSGTVNNAFMASEQILEEYPKADITVIDSLCASAGGGLLVYYAVEMLKRGASKDEIVKFVEENKLKVNHWFTVEDLVYLKRGGRLSGTAAAIGTLLDIKPIMHVDNAGRLVPVTKVKGRKKSIKALAEQLDARIIREEEQTIFISHADCIQDATTLKNIILDKHKFKEIIICDIGPTIGAHSGPGTLALFFLGEKR